MKIAFVGGGSLGPVTPLLAVHARLKERHPELEAFWMGTPTGPEREIVQRQGFDFFAVPVAKIPRYWSKEWFLFPFSYLRAVQVVRRLLRVQQVDAIVTAGGFTAVPVVRVAAKLGIPCVTHQLDRLPGLANRFVADRCTRVTTSFHYPTPPFGDDVETTFIPTPTQFSLQHLPARSQALRELGLSTDKPTICVMGGGTGAQRLNELVFERWGAWRKRGWQVICITGKGKLSTPIENQGVRLFELCTPEEMRRLYAASDVLVCRAGMGTISEAVALRKPMVLVPIPGNQQEVNARALAEAEGAIVLDQRDADFSSWVEKAISRYLRDAPFTRLTVDRATKIVETDRGEALADVVEGVLDHAHSCEDADCQVDEALL